MQEKEVRLHKQASARNLFLSVSPRRIGSHRSSAACRSQINLMSLRLLASRVSWAIALPLIGDGGSPLTGSFCPQWDFNSHPPRLWSQVFAKLFVLQELVSAFPTFNELDFVLLYLVHVSNHCRPTQVHRTVRWTSLKNGLSMLNEYDSMVSYGFSHTIYSVAAACHSIKRTTLEQSFSVWKWSLHAVFVSVKPQNIISIKNLKYWNASICHLT